MILPKKLKTLIASTAIISLVLQVPLSFAATTKITVTQKNIGGLNLAIGAYNAQVAEFTVEADDEYVLSMARVRCLNATGLTRMRLKYNGDTISSVIPEEPGGSVSGLEAIFLPDFQFDADTEYTFTVHANIDANAETHATSCAIVEEDHIRFQDLDEDGISKAYVDINYGISNGTHPIYIESKEVVESKKELSSGSSNSTSSSTEVTFDPQPEDLVEDQLLELPAASFEDDVLTAFSGYENPFPDTSLEKLTGQAAAELYRREIIKGYDDGEFKKANPVNRAELAKFLLETKLEAITELTNNGKFNDVQDGVWYTSYVMLAAQENIISGYPDETFKPGNQVNTAEFLKMLTLTFGIEENLPHTYGDVASDVWFAPYAGAAAKYELFPDRTSSELQPGKLMSRGEVAVAIYQYLANR